MKRRIWVLSELYYPEESATGYYLTRIAEGLAGEFDVHVLSAQPTYLARGTRAPKIEVHAGVSIRRCSGTTFNKNNLLSRTVNLVTISISIFLRSLVELRRGDTVLAVTNPPTLPFVAALACKVRGAQLVLKIEDLYPDALVAAGIVRRDALLARVFDRAQGWLYRFATRIVVLGRDTQEILSERHPGIAPKIVYIPHWADLSVIRPAPREENRLLAKLGLGDKFVVQYSGNMGRTHDIETIVEAAASLQAEQHIHFLMIGWGGKERWLRETCAARALSNVTVLPPLPRNELPDSLNAADVALVTLVGGMLGVSVPSRLYNVLAAGKALIVTAHEDAEIARVVREERVGWVVRSGDAAGLAAAIRDASADPARLADIRGRARAAAEQKYAGGTRYAELFRTLDPGAR